MKRWVVSFTNGSHPLVLQQVPATLAERRDPTEGDVYVSWRSERAGVWVMMPRWAMPEGGGPKQTFYPWHIISSVEEYGSDEE